MGCITNALMLHKTCFGILSTMHFLSYVFFLTNFQTIVKKFCLFFQCARSAKPISLSSKIRSLFSVAITWLNIFLSSSGAHEVFLSQVASGVRSIARLPTTNMSHWRHLNRTRNEAVMTWRSSYGHCKARKGHGPPTVILTELVTWPYCRDGPPPGNVRHVTVPSCPVYWA